MIRSMTAFAQAEASDERLTVTVEIRSYNSRHLDTALRLPPPVQPLEDRIKGVVTRRISRGRVELKLHLQENAETPCAFEIDTARAEGYLMALRQLKQQFDLSEEITLDHLLRLSGVVRPLEAPVAVDAYWPVVETCLEKALAEHDAMRLKEGEFLKNDFEARLSTIEAAVEEIAKMSEGLLESYMERLKERVAALTEGVVEIEPSRIAQEAAFLAERSDISEEVVRVRSHVAQFRAAIKGGEPAGRKLNFLLQEFNREFNTIGSKTQKSDVSHIVVGLKAEVEKIREQVQNIE